MLTSLLTNRRTMEDLSSKGIFRSSGQRDENNDYQLEKDELSSDNYSNSNYDDGDDSDHSDYDSKVEDGNNDDNYDNIDEDDIEALNFDEEKELSIIEGEDESNDMSYCTIGSNNTFSDHDNKKREIENRNNTYYNKYVHDAASFEDMSDEDENEFNNKNDYGNESVENQTKVDRLMERGMRGRVLHASRSEPKPPPYSECSVSDSVGKTPISLLNPPPPPDGQLLPPPPYTWTAGANLHDRKLEKRNNMLPPKTAYNLSSSSSPSTTSSPLSASPSTSQSRNQGKARSKGLNTNQPVFSRSCPYPMQSSRPSYRNIDRSLIETSSPSTNCFSSRVCTTADGRTNANISQLSESKSSMRSTGQFSPSTFSKNRGLERVLGGTKGVFRRLDTINSSTQHKHKHQHDSHRIGCNNHNSNLSFRNDYDDDGRSIYGYSKLNRITEHSLRQQVFYFIILL